VVLDPHAALFGCLMARCHMAGEWSSRVEAKGFAYVLVLLGWKRWCATAGIAPS